LDDLTGAAGWLLFLASMAGGLITEWRDMKSRKRFKREPRLYEINFEDGDLDGFEIIMRGVSLEGFIEIAQLSAALETPEGRTPENIEAQFTILAELLVEWNLDDAEDNPVPATYDGLKTQDFSDVMKIMGGYMQAIASVPKASENDSNSGGISQEQSLGLASLSSVPAS
jgi:hypothetical protein